MKYPIKILITGVGSELSLSVIKASKLLQFPVNLVGCDMQPNTVGRFWCDDFAIVPPARRELEYISALMSIVRSKRIRTLIPTADAEIPVVSKYKKELQEKLGCHALVNNIEELMRFNDKWQAAQWYAAHSIPAPKTYLAEDIVGIEGKVEEFCYPMVLKPRIGGGSRFIFRVDGWEDILRYQPAVPNPILQECLLPDDAEYTAGTYRTRDDKVHVIILRRTLKFGMTNTAESIVDRPDLEAFCKKVILHTRLQGANNIQFRDTFDGPKVLEINPRFSGTTGIRAECGFNDLEMWIAEIFNIGAVAAPVIRERSVLRYMEEIYTDSVS